MAAKTPPSFTKKEVLAPTLPKIEEGVTVVWSLSRTGPWQPAICARVNGDGTLYLMVFTMYGTRLAPYSAVRHRDTKDEYDEGMPSYGYWDFTDRDKRAHARMADLERQVADLVEAVTK